MITKFIKELKNFYKEVYESDLNNLSLEELKNLNSRYADFYKSPILFQNNTEQEKINNVVAFNALSLATVFYTKNNYSEIYFNFLDKVINCLESDTNSLETIIKEYLGDTKLRVDKFIKRFTERNNCFNEIINHSDLDSYNYLYYYGKNITENHFKIVDHFNTISDEKITEMAQSIIDAFLRGVKESRINFTKKKHIRVYYPIGFEKVAKKISSLLENKLEVIFSLMDNSSFDKQLNYNHRYDYNLFQTQKYVDDYLSYLESQFKENLSTFSELAGNIYIETFGETRFNPINGNEVFKKDANFAAINSSFDTKYGIIYDKYIRSDSSFTIVSYPCPEIGEDFEKIFDETVIINTLDNNKYEAIHKKIIDALDKAKYVHITGRNGNKTDLTVALSTLEDPETQTLFENCCAAVNVPVGEVFTSPKLKGTNGILHVSEIYLHGWKFVDLLLEIKDGFITNYSCRNFDTENENKEYINEHLLYDNKTLPMGEFAIGTNTYAYVMGNKYNINDKLDILIAEKTGPHFAFGDTCYSMQEDIKTFNPDGKEIIAKDNEVTLLRHSNIDKAYYGVHTDVTIPYNELNNIVALSDNNQIPIIQNGKFVLEGTEELNIEGM